MKKYLLVLLLVIFIIPSIAFASWWNPFSWSWFGLFKDNSQTEQINNSTTTTDLTIGLTKEITILGDANFAYDKIVYPGEKNVKLGGFEFEAKSDSSHNSIGATLQAFTVEPYYVKNFSQYITNLQLYNSDTNEVLQTKSDWSIDATTITFSNLNISIPSGTTARLSLRADILPNAPVVQETGRSIGNVLSFMIKSNSVVLLEPNIQIQGLIVGGDVQIMTNSTYNIKTNEQQCVAQAEQNHTNANHCLGF